MALYKGNWVYITLLLGVLNSIHNWLGPTLSSWWLNQPTWNIYSSKWIISPSRAKNKKCLKPPPSHPVIPGEPNTYKPSLRKCFGGSFTPGAQLVLLVTCPLSASPLRRKGPCDRNGGHLGRGTADGSQAPALTLFFRGGLGRPRWERDGPQKTNKFLGNKNSWLVVEPTHLKNMLVKMGNFFPNFSGWK